MQIFKGVHHIAIICADYERSKAFYTGILGFEIIREVYRAERNSYKLDLSLNGDYLVELFSFPAPTPRPTHPEAAGLRHLAFKVTDIEMAIQQLHASGISTEPIRIDEHTSKRFTFFRDPDELPIELCEE